VGLTKNNYIFIHIHKLYFQFKSNAMSKAHIAAKQPKEVEIIAGKTYAWCTCGLSENQPFCDGNHKKGDLRPQIFKAEKDETAWLCHANKLEMAPFAMALTIHFSE
jgi:CDGSH-type Zn-finger protein